MRAHRAVIGAALAAIALIIITYAATLPDQRFRPLVGGIQYESYMVVLGSRYFIDRCTLGFPVAKASSPSTPFGYVSAKHCVGDWPWVDIYQPRGTDDQNHIGWPEARSNNPDAFVIRVKDTSWVSNQIVSLPSGYRFKIAGYLSNDVINGSDRNEVYQKTGRSTLTTAGYNLGVKKVMVNWDIKVVGVLDYNGVEPKKDDCKNTWVIAGQGDSGGPVFKTVGDMAYVAGIAFAGDGCCWNIRIWDGSTIRACDTLYYETYDNIARALGVVGWR